MEPQWHLWMSQGVDVPPSQDPLMSPERAWAKTEHTPNFTMTRGAYKPYSTYVSPSTHLGWS
jgi:NADH:ubiquinone oxidoreductase subunit